MPAERLKAEKAKVDNVPKRERWPPIIARRLRAVALERPHTPRQSPPQQAVVLYQRVAKYLAVVVVNKTTAQSVGKNNGTNQKNRNDPLDVALFHLIAILQWYKSSLQARYSF